MSTLSGGSQMTDGPKYRLKTSMSLIAASYLAVFSFVLLLIAFASPYWLSSHQYTYKNFVRLGLWDFCFNNYRHPPYQYDETFSGCYWIYSSKYQNIRDWLQPGWFIFVQAMMCVGLCFSIFTLATISLTIMHFFIKYQVVILATSFGLEILAAIPLMLAWLVFAIMHSDRSWLMYPMYNHLDWSFYTAVAASFFHCLTAFLLFNETTKTRNRRQKLTNLVYNMHPTREPSDAFDGEPLQRKSGRHLHFTQV